MGLLVENLLSNIDLSSKNILAVGIDLDLKTDSLLETISLTLSGSSIKVLNNVNSLLTELRTLGTSGLGCLIFDDISLGRGMVFSREETNDNRTTVIVLIKMLSQNKKIDPKKIVVKIGYTGEYFEKYKKELISYGVLAENIFEKPANYKKVADAVVKILKC